LPKDIGLLHFSPVISDGEKLLRGILGCDFQKFKEVDILQRIAMKVKEHINNPKTSCKEKLSDLKL